jgi:hypothetical protein
MSNREWGSGRREHLKIENYCTCKKTNLEFTPVGLESKLCDEP